ATHMTQKHVQKALDECERHLKRMEKDTVVASVIYYLKGQIFRDLKQNEAAETAYRESIRINPRHTNPYRGLARLLLQAGRMDEAITLNLELSKQRPDLAFAHADVAMMYEKNNQLDLAETHYQKALKIDPNHMAAANNLAFLYAEQNRNLNKALELARRAKEKLGNVPAIMDTLGWVFYKKSLYDSAAQEFESCVKRVPKNPIFHYHLGLTYHKLSQYKKAKKYLKEALRLQPDFKGAQEARSLMERL
ncbi:MAG: tetratricopeptide repeat protein, partial [Desulfovibrionales bacterium]|nr:tetratricopeptide repeat protein [Desulfovibrionales bacterium]